VHEVEISPAGEKYLTATTDLAYKYAWPVSHHLNHHYHELRRELEHTISPFVPSLSL
jgi:hypothetical protein